MTGSYGMTLPVMLAVGLAAGISKRMTYGTIYTTKLLRRGTDIYRLRAPTRMIAETAVPAAGVETGDHYAEGDLMRNLIYKIYMRATPEQIWRGLTDPAFTKRYWRHERAGVKTFRSDWNKGSTWVLEHQDVGLVVSDAEMVILESDPYHRLAYTWHSFTPEWAAEIGMDDFTADAWRAEARSKVGYDIQDVGQGVTKLTVVHDGFSPDSPVLRAVSEGWPSVLSSLKTLLETGTALA